jgi:hypothetical protein
MNGGSINWGTIESDPDTTTALNNASTALSAASSAASNASTAINLIGEIASDSKLTAVEKSAIKKEWDIIDSEKTLNVNQALQFTVDSTDYVTNYNLLKAYVTPLLSDMAVTSTIDSTHFRLMFRNYYDARTELLNNISDKAKSLADAAQSTADSAKADAKNVADGKYVGTYFNRRIINSPSIVNTQSGLTDNDASGIAWGDTGYTPLNTDIRIWAGSNFTNRASAPFRVNHAGAVEASNINITGGKISGGEIDVTTDAKVGNNLTVKQKIILSDVSATASLQWGAGINKPNVNVDGGGAMNLSNNGNPIYANGTRIDIVQGAVATFG